ncbi:hypothetical protein FB565_006628 [Actinoplanes lutulentus]|uniref:Uncharacterized protein n=1 Tax=Actinoplanes lutulentus TaxID=1287878 RepID=A0A327ZAN7_9ACTN|nr:hypothetical protein [Actinoplanes lutulentus]MBB2946860.1 hypothetical protein [Actinoplanes lutulentus]RAK35754.1 hypothetical protein B0I29_109228 [Actinoplanes lutulentus]
MSSQSADPARRIVARLDRLLPAITGLLTDGGHQRRVTEAAGRVLTTATSRPAVALLAESGGDDRLVSHHVWAPLLGDGAAGLTPARTTIGYVTTVRLNPVAAERAAIRGASVSFLTHAHVLECRTRLLGQVGDSPAGDAADVDWPAALELARSWWSGADSARQAGIAELAALYRAQIFAERFLGRDGVRIRLDAVHHATMPVRWGGASGGRLPFPDTGGAGPYEADQDLGQNVLHRVLPVVRRVVVDVDVPQERWPIGEDGLDLIDLPLLDPRLRTGRADWLIEAELATAGAVVTIDGSQREAEKLLVQLRTPTPLTLPGPDSYLVLRDGSALAGMRADICERGQAACLTERGRRTGAAYDEFRRTVRRVVVALDESPLAAAPPPAPAEMRVRDLLARIGAELSAMTADVERGIAGPADGHDGGATPYAALRQWVTAQIYAWPQWPVLFSALRNHVLAPGTRYADEMPATPEVFEMRFRALARDIPEACARVIDAAVDGWLRRWAVRLSLLRTEFFEMVVPLRDSTDKTVGQLRRGVQINWIADLPRPEPVAPAATAVRAAFPLDPARHLPWHPAAGRAGGNGRHLMTIMRVRRELVVAAQRIAEEQLATALTARIEAVRRELRMQQQVHQRADTHVRALFGDEPGGPVISPQAVARRIEDLLDRADAEDER